MKLKPLHDKVLVRRIETEEVSGGGIVLAPSAVEKPNLGTVLSVGPGKLVDGELVTPVVFEGDTVLFGKNAGYEVKVGEEKLIMISEDEIYATLK